MKRFPVLFLAFLLGVFVCFSGCNDVEVDDDAADTNIEETEDPADVIFSDTQCACENCTCEDCECEAGQGCQCPGCGKE